MKVQKTSRRALFAAAIALTGVVSADAQAVEPTWAAAATARVKPGVMTNNPSGQCTANFVFYDTNNDIYIGQSAHCTSLGGPTDTNGCLTQSRAIGTQVTVGGAAHPGTMVYNSWIAMRAANEPTNSPQCLYNDFAVVKLDSRDYAKVNPSIPFWGGPMGTNTSGVALGQRVYTYGNSSLRLGLSPLSPKTGIATGTCCGGWSHDVYTVSPGIPGDSGSAVLDRNGNALGTLSTLGVDGSNGVTDIHRALSYLRSHSTGALATLTLALGTVPFSTPA